MDIIKSIEHEQLKNKVPELKVGNTVKVYRHFLAPPSKITNLFYCVYISINIHTNK